MKNEYISLKFIKISQPIGDFFVSVMAWEDLIAIANADIRKIHEEDTRNDSFDSYLGIQRRISPNRIKEIGEYVNTVDATFPTSIILHINSSSKYIKGVEVDFESLENVDIYSDEIEVIDNIIIDNESAVLKIRRDDKVARILDGQHRMEGLRNGFQNNSEKRRFDFNVTIFIDLDMDDQAQIFSIINKAQTKVNKSLVYDLYEYASTRSPQKTSHDIVRLLNKLNNSPFYKKIKILGTTENYTETIAQATFVELIMGYISKNPMNDRDMLKRKVLFGKEKLHLLTDIREKKRLIFRNLFVLEKDEEIMKILWEYFSAVQERWPNSWNEINRNSGNILNKSTGLIALMRFLRDIYNYYYFNNDIPPSLEDYRRTFELVKIDDFNKDVYIPGSSGQGKLYNDFIVMSKITT